jgi:single-strand DNA-binding protein
MAGGLNKAILIGNLGADPEMRHTPSGKPVATFNIATNEQWRNSDGEQQSRTEWHRIVAWGRLAEICGQYLQKGSQVYIEGRIQSRSWEDKQGITRRTTEIVANNLLMLGRAPGGSEGTPDAESQEQEVTVPSDASDDLSDNDDIPF